MVQADVSRYLFASECAHADPPITVFRTSSASSAAHNFAMPALSPTMTEGTITKWNVKEGPLLLSKAGEGVSDEHQVIPSRPATFS